MTCATTALTATLLTLPVLATLAGACAPRPGDSDAQDAGVVPQEAGVVEGGAGGRANADGGGGAAGGGGGAAGANVDAANPGPVGPVWTESSVGFHLREPTRRAPWPEHQDYRTMKPTAAQLSALRRLTLVTDARTCPADTNTATLTVFDEGGARRTFYWTDYPCGARPALTDPGYQALIEAVPSCTGPRPAGDGCVDYMPLSVPSKWSLKVRAGEGYAISMVDCEAASVTIRLKDSTGTLLATGTPAPTACSRIEHRFVVAGDYVVEWDLQPGAVWVYVGADRLPDN